MIISSTTDTNLKTEYVVNITEPEPLAVSGKSVNIKSNEVFYHIEGGNDYTINLNGTVYNTSDANINLPLVRGVNTIEIKTDKECQGVFKETIFFNNQVLGYPNPMTNEFNIDMGFDESKEASVTIHNSIGKLIYNKVHMVSDHKINVNTKNLTVGLYMVTIKTKNNNENIKIIKNSN